MCHDALVGAVSRRHRLELLVRQRSKHKAVLWQIVQISLRQAARRPRKGCGEAGCVAPDDCTRVSGLDMTGQSVSLRERHRGNEASHREPVVKRWTSWQHSWKRGLNSSHRVLGNFCGWQDDAVHWLEYTSMAASAHTMASRLTAVTASKRCCTNLRYVLCVFVSLTRYLRNFATQQPATQGRFCGCPVI